MSIDARPRDARRHARQAPDDAGQASDDLGQTPDDAGPPPNDATTLSGSKGQFEGGASQPPGSARPVATSGAADLAARQRGLPRLAAHLVAVEPLLALPCALLLLLYPNALVVPAALVGVLPSLARLLATGRPWRRSPFDLPLALLSVGAILGALASLNRDAAMIRLAGLLAGLILFSAAREHVRTARQARFVVLALLALSVVACVALLVIVAPFLRLDHVPPLAALVQSLDRWDIGRQLANEDWLLQRYRFRASGVGAMAVVGVALVMATLVGSRARRAVAPLALLAAFFIATLVAADNRGAMLAAVLTMGASAAVWKRRLLLLIPLGGLVLAVALASGLVERGLTLRTLSQRFWFWENALYLAREVPFTGAGLGLDSVRLTYQAYFQPAYPPFSHAHNIYLQGLLEYGVLGLFGLCGLVVATLWLGWRAQNMPNEAVAEGATGRWIASARVAGFGIAFAMLAAGLSEIVALATVGGAMLLGAAGLLAATATATRPAIPSVGVTKHKTWRSAAPGSPSRGALAAAGTLAVLVIGFILSGGAARVTAVVVLDAGTAELNRGTLSEWITREERAAAIDRAVWLLDRAASLDPDSLAAQRNLAIAFAALNEERPARDALDRARTLLDPAAPTAFQDQFQVGRAYAALNDWGGAIRAWEGAQAGPQLLQLGTRLMTRARNYGQATAAFTAAAFVQPDSRGAYDGIAQVAKERGGTTDDMVRALQPMVAHGGLHEYMARLEIARAYRDAGRLADAAHSLATAEALGTSPELSFEYGVLMALGERWEPAERYLLRPAADLPLAAEHWSWLAYSQLRLGRPAEALATVELGFANAELERRADRLALQTLRAESLLALGRPAEAQAALDEAQATRSGDARARDDAARIGAAAAGAPPNLVTNGSFSWDGGWARRERGRDYARSLVGNERPRPTEGVVRVVGAEAGEYVVAQEVWGLEPGATYRLRLNARREGLGSGTASVEVVGRPIVRAGYGTLWTARPDWTPLEMTFEAATSNVTLELWVSERGAANVAAFDDVSLVKVAPAR